jgi:hypothetical protein
VYPDDKSPFRIFCVGGKSFPICLAFDEQSGESYPLYPDFEATPEYTDDGQPFATAEQERCPCAKPATAGLPTPGDCGGCGWFYREHTPYDPIGICTCGSRRRDSDERIEDDKQRTDE